MNLKNWGLCCQKDDESLVARQSVCFSFKWLKNDLVVIDGNEGFYS